VLNSIFFSRRAGASNVASSDIWQESAKRTLLRLKSNKGDKYARTCSLVLPVNYPGRSSNPVNQEPESDLDVPRIIHLELNVAQQDHRRNLSTLAVELDGKPVNASVESDAQGCFISERLASTLSATKITSNPP
jgi:hypothetical protein